MIPRRIVIIELRDFEFWVKLLWKCIFLKIIPEMPLKVNLIVIIIIIICIRSLKDCRNEL